MPAVSNANHSSESKTRRALCLLLLLVAGMAAASCTAEAEWSEDQQAVYEAMQEWAKAVEEQDGEAMWDMLSPDAKEWYERELKGARRQYKLDKAVVDPDSRASEEDKDKARRRMESIPEEPDDYTPKQYYIWKHAEELTPGQIDSQARAFAKSNIEEIHVDDESATVKLREGDPERYSWVRHDGVWKFGLGPSILRALKQARAEEARASENRN